METNAKAVIVEILSVRLLALDAASNEFYSDGTYKYEGKSLNSSEMI